MDFKMRKYEICPQCHNIKQVDGFVVREVQSDRLLMDYKCKTCELVDGHLYEKIACAIPKEGRCDHGF